MISLSDNIAVLITCHDRVQSTLRCLDALFVAVENGVQFVDVYLVDDGSSDGTAEIVSARYPQVQIIAGHGSLYWCGGMRLAWQSAAVHADYRFYLWLNDDVVVNNYFIGCLLQDYVQISKQFGSCLITGGCCDPVTGKFTYGGRDDKQLLKPTGMPQQCKYIHGNVVLVPREIFEVIGGFSELFTHAFGDTDYGLRTIEAGFSCWTSSVFVGSCQQHQIKGPWASSKVPLKRRAALFVHPLGLNFKEFVKFRRRHWPLRWMLDVVKVCIQVLCPQPFEWLSRVGIARINVRRRGYIEEKGNG